MKGRIVSNLTSWEVGQDLIAVADLISEKDGEIRNSGFNEQSDALRRAREIIAEVFDKHHLKSHGFGLGSRKPAPVRTPAEKGESENGKA